MKARLVEIALAALIVAICAPGVIWWLITHTAPGWGPLP